jgi:hypothetical protein
VLYIAVLAVTGIAVTGPAQRTARGLQPELYGLPDAGRDPAASDAFSLYSWRLVQHPGRLHSLRPATFGALRAGGIRRDHVLRESNLVEVFEGGSQP